MLPSAERDHRIGCWLAAAAFAVVVWLVVGSIRALDKPLRIVTLPGTRVYYYLTPETGDFTAESFEVTGRGILVHQGSLLFELRRPAGSWDAVLEPFLVTERLDELDRFTVDAGG
ncbi:MAG TPA: hypothetical protein VFX98_08890 [Longimicrobiaceae bacterium]|nr:hypothetical protein [Longimicrobiaceae bacterium]